MRNIKFRSRGFTLIAALLLLLLMSGLAIGLLMSVNTEGRVGGNDLEHNISYHSAEGAIENMTSVLANTFQNIQAPTVGQITALSNNPPTNDPTITYTDYSFTPVTNPDGTLWSSYGQITSGQNSGLYAQLLKVNLTATAQRPLGDQVSMTRQVEVALIPVFQFGVFSDGDLSFFAGSTLDFNGRVHTNADLYVAANTGNALTFHDKVSVWGNVIRWELPNGSTTAASGHLGSVFVPQASQGCDGARPKCGDLGADTANNVNQGSVVANAAGNTWTTGGQSGAWWGVSTGTFNGWILDGNWGLPGGTGANLLSLPFVNGAGAAAGGPQPYEIVRQPPAGENPTSPLGAARLYNEAQIRVLLADSPDELPHPGYANGSADPNNIRLANGKWNSGPDFSKGVPTSFNKIAGMPALPGADQYTTYFATASTLVPTPASPPVATLPADWLFEPLAPLAGDITLFDVNAPLVSQGVTGGNNVGLQVQPPNVTVTACSAGNSGNPPYPYYTPTPNPSAIAANETVWNLLDGYLRVEYVNAAGATVPVTQEWLQLGFARDTFVPTAPGGQPGGNDVNPNAILILQKPADRNADGAANFAGVKPACKKVGGVWTTTTVGTVPEVVLDGTTNSPWYGDSNNPVPATNYTAYNWYPINFYDAREGEVRDTVVGNDSCTPAGVMNAVELDVGNLKRWLNGTIAGSGNLVNFSQQNGYVLYFSDRRGMLPNPNGTPVDPAGTKTGDSGLEDAINTGSAVGTPDGALQATPAGKTQSPEDVNNNLRLDNFGAANLGLGLGYVGAAYTTGNNVNRRVMAGANPDPYLTVTGRMPACTVAWKNWVSGARHVLKLVDGSLGNVPVRLDTGKGGFTVGSENPVYIFGNYNSNCTAAGQPGCTPGNGNFDATWNNAAAAEPVHSAAAVIADSVSALSNNWSDFASLNSPSTANGRVAVTTYYRTAVSAGKNINFPTTGLAWAAGDYGTDGGLHNFLRLLEAWGGQVLNYKGSMVSMYYSTYATGTDKNGGAGGNTVYNPPATRNYTFDPLFTQPQNLPPATPMFRDIDNLSYTEIFNPRSN